jgi:hypothetical protein
MFPILCCYTSMAVEEDWRDEVLKTMKHLGVGLLEVN